MGSSIVDPTISSCPEMSIEKTLDMVSERDSDERARQRPRLELLLRGDARKLSL